MNLYNNSQSLSYNQRYHQTILVTQYTMSQLITILKTGQLLKMECIFTKTDKSMRKNKIISH